MIDLHCHILPDVDDGAASLATAVAMARHAVQDGITTICATPHMFDGRYDVTPSAARAALALLREALARESVALEVRLGAECRLSDGLLEAVRAGAAPTLGDGPHILIELAPGVLPSGTERLLFELRMRGLRPILAHPERHGVFQGRGGIDRLRRFVEQETWVQVTAGALTGAWGPETESCARRIVSAGLCHVLASDAHGERWRAPELARARGVLESMVGPDEGHAMLVERPCAVLSGLAAHASAPTSTAQPSPPRRGWLQRLLHG